MGKAIDLKNWKGPGAAGYVPRHIVEALVDHYKSTGGETTAGKAVKDALPQETDEQIDARLQETFATLRIMTAAAIAGEIHSLVVSGPPGMSKSYETDKQFSEAMDASTRGKTKRKCVDVHGYVRPTGLYKMLFENADEKSTIKFDDADSIFKDMTSLNILKAALDMKARRRVSWLAETKMKTEDGGDKVPRHFDFCGAVIFVTNIDFAAAAESGSEISEHMAALMSRSHYLDIGIHTLRDRLIRVKRVVLTEHMLQGPDFGMKAKQEEEIHEFVVENQKRLREVSLRMVAKIANLAVAKPQEWHVLARATCMSNNSFKAASN